MDKRKDNGGHSTVKKDGIDKRKNEYRNALKEAADLNDVVEVLRAVMSKAKKGDVKAAQLFLDYYLGKPTNTIEFNTGEGINFAELFKFKND